MDVKIRGRACNGSSQKLCCMHALLDKERASFARPIIKSAPLYLQFSLGKWAIARIQRRRPYPFFYSLSQTAMIDLLLSATEGEVRMAQYICVEVDHHEKITMTIEDHERNGWRLHTYQAVSKNFGAVSHYLLFERHDR